MRLTNLGALTMDNSTALLELAADLAEIAWMIINLCCQNNPYNLSDLFFPVKNQLNHLFTRPGFQKNRDWEFPIPFAAQFCREFHRI
jgi:hypothetical protein